LTARHVVDDARDACKASGLELGLLVRGSKPAFYRLIATENAPPPFDIVLGRVNHKLDPLFRLVRIESDFLWKDVATFGYPLNSAVIEGNDFLTPIRGKKGYVQRIIQPNELVGRNNPPGFELNFLLGRGMSGAPLFIYAGSVDHVVGVCVGSIRSETIVDTVTDEVSIDGKRTIEVRTSVEEFGVAHDLRSLFDWRPKLLGGRSLFEAASPVRACS
jgi:hypothetical protein